MKRDDIKKLILYFDQIPDGYDVENYPDDTEFILDDSPLERDSETFELIPRPKREKVYPPNIR